MKNFFFKKTTIKGISSLVIFFFFSIHIPIIGSYTAAAKTKERDVAIFVIPKDKSDSNAALLLSGILRNQLFRLASVKPAKKISPPPDEIGLESSEAYVMEGKRALNTLDSKGAKTAYSKAIEIIERILPAQPRELIAKAYKGMGISLLLENNIPDGKKMIRRSLLLYKNQLPSEYSYRVEIKNIFLEVQKEVENAPSGSIRISTNNDPAEIYHGGQFKGFTPITLSNLPEGEHFITIMKDAFYKIAKFVEVAGGKTINIDINLDRTADASTINSLIKKASSNLHKSEGPPELTQLKNLLIADELIMVSVNAAKNKFILKGFYVDSEGLVKSVNETIVQDARLLDNVRGILTAFLGTETIPERAEPPLETPAQGESIALPSGGIETVGEGGIIDPNSPIFKDTTKKAREDSLLTKWWFWTIVGGVVVGGVAGVYFLTTSSGGVQGPTGELGLKFHKPAICE